MCSFSALLNFTFLFENTLVEVKHPIFHTVNGTYILSGAGPFGQKQFKKNVDGKLMFGKADFTTGKRAWIFYEYNFEKCLVIVYFYSLAGTRDALPPDVGWHAYLVNIIVFFSKHLT
jgi:hypothetical protein